LCFGESVQCIYPSLIRDLHFLTLCLDSDCFDKVRFSLVDGYYNGIDLQLEYAEFDFEVALHLNSKRGNFYKKLKYKRHNYNREKEIVLTLNKDKLKSVSNFHLSTED